jgi:lipopolysaccharide export system permease protein
MTRLAAYLVRLFGLDALALFGVALFLLFLAQCLRSFEIVSVKGQDMLTLVGQTALSMPTLALAFSHVCLAIGLARGLRNLQQSQELHIIHSSRRLSALAGGIGTYVLGGTVLVLLLSNLIEPLARHYHNERAAEIAADLVSRTLTPNRFIEIAEGVTLVIASRGENGALGSFFADDRRSESTRRTYNARSAVVAADDEGYVLQLSDGSIQYLTDEGEFSEISFTRHDLAVEGLTGDIELGGSFDGVTTPDIIAQAQATGLTRQMASYIGNRMGEGFRVIAMCLLAAGLAAFPHGRRNRRQVPIEITLLAAAFIDRGLTSAVGMPGPFFPPSGTVFLAVIGLAILAFKLRKLRPVPRREALA